MTTRLSSLWVSQKRGAMLFVALEPVRRQVHDGTSERQSMLLRHTGTQLLCPTCGVALCYLWAASILLLWCTALRLAAKKKNGGFHSLWRRYFPGDGGTYSCTLCYNIYAQVFGRSVAIATKRTQQRTPVLTSCFAILCVADLPRNVYIVHWLMRSVGSTASLNFDRG